MNSLKKKKKCYLQSYAESQPSLDEPALSYEPYGHFLDAKNNNRKFKKQFFFFGLFRVFGLLFGVSLARFFSAFVVVNVDGRWKIFSQHTKIEIFHFINLERKIICLPQNRQFNVNFNAIYTQTYYFAQEKKKTNFK